MAKKPVKRSQTLREKAASSAASERKPRRLRQATSTAKGGASALRRTAGREFYLPLPDNKLGRFLNKRRYFIPRYFRESFREVRQVVWPTGKEAFKLTTAVILFTVVFGLAITLTDYGLDKLFRKVLLD